MRLEASADGCPQGARRVTARLGAVLDEHLAVDADRCADARWLAAADVLYGSTVRSREQAAAWLTDVLARHPACAVAATPVAGGLWAACCRPRAQARYVAAGPHAPVGSLLHARLVASRLPARERPERAGSGSAARTRETVTAPAAAGTRATADATAGTGGGAGARETAGVNGPTPSRETARAREAAAGTRAGAGTRARQTDPGTTTLARETPGARHVTARPAPPAPAA